MGKEARSLDAKDRQRSVSSEGPGTTSFGASATVDDDRARQRIVEFLSGYSIETTPKEAARIADYRNHLKPGTAVYIPHVPGTSYDDVVALAARLKREGFRPVPHLAARAISHRAWLEDALRRLGGEAGVEHLLLVGGDYRNSLGPFNDTLQVLETGLVERAGIRSIGVAGHPEGNRFIGHCTLRESLARKNTYANETGTDLYIVSQFGFDATAVSAWEQAIRAQGNELSVRVGMAGPASLRTLVRFAISCGVGPSMRALTVRTSGLAGMVRMAAPDQMVAGLADESVDDVGSRIAGVHVFAFGGLPRAAAWLEAVLAGAFTLNGDGSGFDVHMDAGDW